VLTATGFVNGKEQFSTPYRIDTPPPITKKFVTGDYIGNSYRHAKFGAHPSTGVSGRMVDTFFIYALFRELTYRSDASTFSHDS